METPRSTFFHCLSSYFDFFVTAHKIFENFSISDALRDSKHSTSGAFKDFNVNEMLVSIGTSSDEFYPAVAIATLMKVLKDPLLSTHHKAVVQVNCQVNLFLLSII